MPRCYSAAVCNVKREWATVTCMGSGKEMDPRVEQQLKSVSNFTIIVLKHFQDHCFNTERVQHHGYNGFKATQMGSDAISSSTY